MLDRFGRILRQRYDQPGVPPPATTPETLKPGDALLLQDGRDFLVQSTIDCREDLGGHTTTWRWVLLDDGSLLEVLHHTLSLYDPPDVLHRGTPPYALLTGQGEQDGLLRDFEARERAGTADGMPVSYEHDGVSYQIRSTGTFAATLNGMTNAQVWADVSQNAADNVYFKMESSDGRPALGVWTSDIALYTGEMLAHADIKGMYSR